MTTAPPRKALTTAVLTDPVPLAISQPAALDIIISNGGQREVYCDQIIVILPAGTLAQDLIKTSEKIQASANDRPRAWSFSEVEDGVLEGIPTGEEYVFPGANKKIIFKSSDSNSFTENGLRLHLDGFSVNSEVGTATIAVRTHIRNPGDTDYAWETEYHRLDKYPARPDLVPLANLRIVKGDQSGDTIVTQVGKGDKFTLKWDGPDTDYTLHSPAIFKGEVTLPSATRFYVVEGGVERDTTFTLHATYQKDTHQRTAYLTTTIGVTNPIIESATIGTAQITQKLTAGNVECSNVTATGVIEGKSSITAAGYIESKSNITAAGYIESKSNITAVGYLWSKQRLYLGTDKDYNSISHVAGGGFKADATFTTNGIDTGSITATGLTVNGNASITKNLSTTGSMTAANSLTVSGSLTTNGDVSFKGMKKLYVDSRSNIFGGWQKLPLSGGGGTFTAPSDGLVIVTFQANYKSGVVGGVTITTGEVSVSGYVVASNWNYYDTCTLPVKRDHEFKITTLERLSSISAYWIPLGSGGF
ncbi:hypothetical protein [Streptomyces olivoreticuli]|uniref:hypothetical protein n=1 Tax=Streptomyces olivoreticuli TaxID=68246 RepID=UPI0013C36230|nr:hypothetical protein [Streptomyces olivoreticuli]